MIPLPYKQRGPKRSFAWLAILGTLWAWFGPLAILRSSFLPALSVGCKMNTFKEIPILGWVSFHCPNSSSPVSLHGVLLGIVCMYLCGYFVTWCLFKHLTPQIWSLQKPSIRSFRWSEDENSEFTVNWLEKHQIKAEKYCDSAFLCSIILLGDLGKTSIPSQK